MIKFNENYSFNNGQGTIVFTEGKKGTINAEYEIKGNKGKGGGGGNDDDNGGANNDDVSSPDFVSKK